VAYRKWSGFQDEIGQRIFLKRVTKDSGEKLTQRVVTGSRERYIPSHGAKFISLTIEACPFINGLSY